jgi:hypothetical protein
MDEQVDRLTWGQIDRQRDGQIGGTKGQMDRWIKWTNRWKQCQADTVIERWMDNWIHRNKKVQMHEQTPGQTERQTQR